MKFMPRSSRGRVEKEKIVKRISLVLMLILAGALTAAAQTPSEQRSPLNQTATAFDAKSAPAIEATLLTQVLNGSEDSPVMNIKVAVKNITPIFYTYVSGWVTFYDAKNARCGEVFFKVDALAPQEPAEVDPPGLRLRCSPATWRIVEKNLLPQIVNIPKPAKAQTPP